MKKNILMLYDQGTTHIGVVRHYLESFKQYSKHNVYYLPAAGDLPCGVNLNFFDVVMVHYSIRMCYGKNGCILSETFIAALSAFTGQKFLFIQDEYEKVYITKESIKKIKFDGVFTCVPTEYIERVYPKAEFPHVKFISVLTGYVAEELESYAHIPPIAERKNLIVYRGRLLPFIYGDLGRQKYEIGVKVKKLASQYKINPVDIEWDENKRIYGVAWFDFIKSGKATLITESGSNIFDFTGEIQKNLEAATQNKKSTAYDEIYQRFLVQHDNYIKMNQVSPKVFEAIALKTALIGFEGEYSGVIKPYEHFIPLKKDFSNIKEVFDYLKDDDYLQGMVDRAYKDVILSKKYSFEKFVELVESNIPNDSSQRKSQPILFFMGVNDSYLQDNQCYRNSIHGMNLSAFPSNEILDISRDEEYFTAKFLDPNAELLAYQSCISRFLNSRLIQFPIKALKKYLPWMHKSLGFVYYKLLSLHNRRVTHEK